MSGAGRSLPIPSPYWQGETCCMCNGTGCDAFYVTEPSTGWKTAYAAGPAADTGGIPATRPRRATPRDARRMLP